MWTRIIGNGYGSVMCVVATPDGGTAAAGDLEGEMDLIKTDAEGLPCENCGWYSQSNHMAMEIPMVDRAFISEDLPLTTLPITMSPTLFGSAHEECISIVGLEEHAAVEGISIVPHPVVTSSFITIPQPWLYDQPQLFVLDGFGRVVYTSRVNTSPFVFSRGELPTGLYFYRLVDRAGSRASGTIALE